MDSLLEFQRQNGGSMAEKSGFPRFQDFGDFAAEYRAAIADAALFDLTGLGVLRVTGKDALDLLHRLTMNEMRNLEVGAAVVNGFADAKGKVQDAVLMIRRDGGMQLLTSAFRAPAVKEWIERYTFVEQIEIREQTDSYTPLLIAGPAAQDLLDADLPAFRTHSVKIAGAAVEAIRVEKWLPRGVLLLVPKEHAASVTRDLVSGAANPARLAGAAVFHALRVAQGVPLAGSEIDGDSNPYECGLESFISFTKGCYTGQEVIARLDTYDRVKHRFVGVWIDGELPPAPALVVDDGGREVGKITSVAHLPDVGRNAGLARIRRGAMKAETPLFVAADAGGAAVRLRNFSTG